MLAPQIFFSFHTIKYLRNICAWKWRTGSNNGCSGVDLSKMGDDFIGDISFLEIFEESADALL